MSTVSAKAGTPSVPPKAVDSATHSEIMRTVGSLASSPLPRAAPARPGFTFDLSELQPGELYVGVVRSGGISRHLILLPAEASGVSWQQAKTFAAAVGGELPDMGDFDVLLQNAQHEFAEDDSYWSSEWLNKQEALYLDFGPHPFRDWDSVDALMRARAVRRTFAGLEQAVLLNWGAHIKRMREAAGLTEDQLAELVDVTPDVVRRWEGGEVRTIDGPLLMQICAALNVDPGWLLGADDE
jgi:DNA-binding transcriptional regulator YiaG